MVSSIMPSSWYSVIYGVIILVQCHLWCHYLGTLINTFTFTFYTTVYDVTSLYNAIYSVTRAAFLWHWFLNHIPSIYTAIILPLSPSGETNHMWLETFSQISVSMCHLPTPVLPSFVGSYSTVVAYWTTGQQVKWFILHLGHDSNQFISLA